MNNYYFDILRVGQLDTSEIFATKESWKGRRSYAPKNLETCMVGGGGMWVGSHPTKMSHPCLIMKFYTIIFFSDFRCIPRVKAKDCATSRPFTTVMCNRHLKTFEEVRQLGK